MNPRYSYTVSIYLEHGDSEPTPEEIYELNGKIDSIIKLVFGNKVLASADVMVHQDEEKEYCVTWDVTLQAQVKVYCKAGSTKEAVDESATRINPDCLHVICLEEDDFKGESEALIVTKYEVIGCSQKPEVAVKL